MPGTPGANEFVPVSCHCLPHPGTQGHKVAKGLAKSQDSTTQAAGKLLCLT